MNKRFDHIEIEKKWQKVWQDNAIYNVGDRNPSREKEYVLVEWPYPSGNLHIGHWYAFAVPDIYVRYRRMTGKQVLFPMGFDAFGLPAENAAIKRKINPKEWTESNIEYMKGQMASMGTAFSWDKTTSSTDEDYYKWTQWMFGEFFKNGIAYRGEGVVNWCPGCNTVIANEQVQSDDTCERCDSKIEKRKMPQWMLKITDFADALIDDLESVDWPEHIKEAQRNWIGRSSGAKINFSLSVGEDVTVFTTRPDTLFGATYMVLAPEHELVQKHKDSITNWEEVEAYIDTSKQKAERDRLDATKEKTGVKLEGITATNPANGEEIPVYIADYVLAGYGTGAIMAVPAHDERDFAFAKKFDIKITPVIYPDHIGGCVKNWATDNKVNISDDDKLLALIQEKIMSKQTFYKYRGRLINSAEFDGLSISEAKEAIAEKVGGEMTNTYRLRDWSIGRQRYWGVPIPIVYSPDGEAHPVPKEHLPWTLPEDVDFTPTGVAPLAKSEELKRRTIEIFGEGWTPEVETMDTFVDSSWYFLRYLDNKNDDELVSKKAQDDWMQVDMYFGGAEHTTMHLLYSRFWQKALKKLGLVNDSEPYKRRINRSLILGPDGNKMSKSKGNVVDPDEQVKLVGSDTVKMYLAFMGPYGEAANYPWDMGGIAGQRRFLERVYGLVDDVSGEEPKEITVLLHKTIKKVGDDIKNFKFNTAISTMMIFVNQAEKSGISLNSYKVFLKVLAPFAPHLTEQIWADLGNGGSIHTEEFPAFDEKMTEDEQVTIGVQINGKMRGEISISPKADESEALKLVDENDSLQSKIDGAEIKKVIYVQGRILNLII
ncbi:leucine--tRNA ligase [Candidatus Nomurabacteria bacterium]|nr:leucine--tRNA ligase [Candidatus Kaiserbacteria bacterium]MCB9810503.1 leucine--tRNA ligase [Candidatus Nomurabacteria bacterium]MCB9818180.1 leucine--tRNA ligase [Candidatus Nomurabacteria bacterium]